MKSPYYILLLVLIFCLSCDIKLKRNEDAINNFVEIQRYDRIETRYLTTGDFSALQQMMSGYPMQTRTLIEDVLSLGDVNEPDINNTFLKFFQDSTLQGLISDAELQYASMDDINKGLSEGFYNLKKMIPSIKIPDVYAQIGALSQSIVIGDGTIGICLDKYLGSKYHLYKKYYSKSQYMSMTREYIVPDCLSFYLLSLYQSKKQDKLTPLQKDLHMGCIMWVTNKALDKKFFKTKYVLVVDKYMKKHSNIDISTFLKTPDFKVLEDIAKNKK